jgi:hypothetical protein
MTSTLTLRLTAHSESGLDPNKWDHASRYEVCGLPLGERAKIGEMEGHHLDGHHWQILLTKDGVPGNWEGDYESREDALAVVEKEFEKWRV